MATRSQLEEASSPAMETATPEISEEAVNMSCKACDKEFDSHEEAIDHVYEAHSGLEECPWCSTKKFAHTEFWRCHLVSHISSDRQPKPIKADNN